MENGTLGKFHLDGILPRSVRPTAWSHFWPPLETGFERVCLENILRGVSSGEGVYDARTHQMYRCPYLECCKVDSGRKQEHVQTLERGDKPEQRLLHAFFSFDSLYRRCWHGVFFAMFFFALFGLSDIAWSPLLRRYHFGIPSVVIITTGEGKMKLTGTFPSLWCVSWHFCLEVTVLIAVGPFHVDLVNLAGYLHCFVLGQ